MNRLSRLVWTIVVLAGLLTAGGVKAGIAAQDASPAAFPTTPDPALCRVEPRSVASLEGFAGAPVATPVQEVGGTASPEPFVPPAGEPADAETVALVAAFATHIFACYNAGDYRRAFALQTDAYLARSFAAFPPTAEDLAFFAAPPVPAPPDQRTELRALRQVVVLPDGRIGSYLDLAYPDGSGETQYGVLVLTDDGLRLDDVPYFAPLAGTPTP